MMAEKLVTGILHGEVDTKFLKQLIQSSEQSFPPDIHIGICNPINIVKDFVPCFLDLLRCRLSPVLRPNVAGYCSPRQQKVKSTQKYQSGKKSGQVRKSPARASLMSKYMPSFSSPDSSIKEESIGEASLFDVSPIKPIIHQREHGKKSSFHFYNKKKNSEPPPTFQLDNLDDFPTIGGPAVNKKGPRRITPTRISHGNTSVSPSSAIVNSSCPAPSSVSQSSEIKTHDVFSIEASLSACLEPSSFELTNVSPLASDRKALLPFQRKIAAANHSLAGSADVSSLNDSHEQMQSLTIRNAGSDFRSLSLKDFNVASSGISLAPSVGSMDNVTDVEVLDAVAEVYAAVFSENLVPNITSELYFLCCVLTATHRHDGSIEYEEPFSSLDNCVYFAVKCLSLLHRLLLLLDKNSLKLIAENYRVKMFGPPEFLKSLLDGVDAESNKRAEAKETFHSPVAGVPFQVESDNKKTFPSDRHFHAFSKQRDGFYAIVREWQERSLDPDWDMKAALGDRIRQLMQAHNTDFNNHLQFAKLFVAQLVDMSREDSIDPSLCHPGTPLGLLSDLKRTDPEKYLRLQERFVAPSASQGPCPKPGFSKSEEFFRTFIQVADSYCFCQNLVCVLASCIVKTNSTRFSLDQSSLEDSCSLDVSLLRNDVYYEVKRAILELKVLAKFCSYVIFLPFHDPLDNDSKRYVQVEDSRQQIQAPFDLCPFIEEAANSHKLLITVPWVVAFLGMADRSAFCSEPYERCLHLLAHIYRREDMKVRSSELGLFQLFILLHIGWLFELPHVPESQFYHVTSRLTINSLPVTSPSLFGVDDFADVDKPLLYAFCPYLSEVRNVLNNAAKGDRSGSGSFRKITPISADFSQPAMDSNKFLKMQMVETFLKHQPKSTKECVDFLTERFTANIYSHSVDVLIPNCCSKAVEELKVRYEFNSEDQQHCDADFVKNLNKKLFADISTDCRSRIVELITDYVDCYLTDNCGKAVKIVLPPDSHEAVLTVTAKLVQHNAMVKVREWMNASIVDVATAELNAIYHRFVMSLIKAKHRT